MMGTGGLELTHFINPDLTWKTVSKGYRSTPRRPRRSLTRNSKVGVDVADKSIRITEELAVSESEKLGVAVLGRRFGDKIDHVPIKKRRLMSRSPSPGTWQAPSHLVDNQHVSGHRSSRNYISKQCSMVTDTATATATATMSNSGISKVLNEKIGYSEDFSGIEILAAAACNNSMDDDSNRYENPVGEISKEQDIGSLTSSMPLEEANTSMKTNNYSQKNLAAEDKLECSPFQDNTTAIKQNLPSEKDDRTAERSVSLRDDRLHWDLNVVMDSWDQHCDAVIIGTETNVSLHNQKSKNLQISEACEMQREPKNMKHAGESIVQPIVDTVVSSDAHGKGMVLEAYGLVGEEHEMEARSDLGGNNGTFFPPRTDNVLESSLCVVAGAKASTLDVGIDACLYPTPCPRLGAITSSGVCKETRNASPVSILVKQETEDCVSDMRPGETFCVHSVQVGKQDVAFPCAPASERDTCENEGTILNEDGEGTGPAFHLYGNDSPREMMCVENCQPLAPVSLEVEPEGNAGEMHVNRHSPRCEDMSASVVSYGDVQPLDLQPMVCTGAKGEPDETSVVHTAEVDPLMHVGSDQLVYKSSENSSCNWVVGESAPHEACADGPASIAGNIAWDGTFEDSHSSDVSQDGRSRMVGMENTKFQAGYDSQFEDGELRESDVCCWGENGVEDDEAERVDYGSDNGETYDFDATDFSVSMPGKVEVRAECEEGRFCILEGENLEKKIKVQLPRGCEIFESKTLEVTHGSAMKKRNIDSVDVDGLDVKDFPIKMVESRASRRELLSRFEKPLSSGTFHRKDSVLVQRSRSNNFDDSNKFLGRDRCAMRMRGRSPFHGRLVNPSAGFWDSKRGYSPTYASVRTGPKYVIESRGNVMASGYTVSGATGGAGLDSRVHRQSTNSSSNGVYRPLIGRRSLADRDEAYGMDTGTRLLRDISPDRRRYRRHPRRFSRGFREEYHRAAPDESIEYTNGMPLRLARKEQSISPLSRERYCTPPYRKSQSRSRSRSPFTWLTPRGRYEGSRWRSRSPDFRPVPRIERLRLPYQKANFAAADEVGSGISPHRNSRWFDDNNSVGDHIRSRRSPVRMFRQRERVDSAYLSRKLNSDDYYGPMMRPGRSPGMGNTGRGCKYEGIDNDRRKNGGRYDMAHRMRRFDTDGVVRRFRYDAEDNFVAHNSNNYDDCDRGPDRRLGRVVSEEKGRLRNNHKDL